MLQNMPGINRVAQRLNLIKIILLKKFKYLLKFIAKQFLCLFNKIANIIIFKNLKNRFKFYLQISIFYFVTKKYLQYI